jgi:hypothetical protein
MQVQQRQHLGHLGALAAPGRQDHRTQADPLTGDQIGAAVIHPRRPHRDRTRGGQHLALAGMAVADHQPPATLVPLGGVGGEVVVDLGLQGGGQHPPGTLAYQLLQVQAQLVMGLGVGGYTQHAAFLPRRRSPRRRFQDLSSGKVRRAPRLQTQSTTSGHTSAAQGRLHCSPGTAPHKRALPACMPCSFGLLWTPRSCPGGLLSGPIGVTVTDR